MRQDDYIYNDILIKRPKHIIWRDAHENMIGYNDYLWIKKINEISKEKKIQLYFLPNNYQYVNLRFTY